MQTESYIACEFEEVMSKLELSQHRKQAETSRKGGIFGSGMYR